MIKSALVQSMLSKNVYKITLKLTVQTGNSVDYPSSASSETVIEGFLQFVEAKATERGTDAPSLYLWTTFPIELNLNAIVYSVVWQNKTWSIAERVDMFYDNSTTTSDFYQYRLEDRGLNV